MIYTETEKAIILLKKFIEELESGKIRVEISNYSKLEQNFGQIDININISGYLRSENNE